MNESLEVFRHEIDRIDAEILRLLNERCRHVTAIGEWKRDHALPVFVPERERMLMKRLEELNAAGPLPDSAVRAIWREIISASRALEEPDVIAFLGPEGSYSHQAAMERFGHSARLLPVPDIGEVFRAMAAGHATYGCVPVENSIEGTVNHTLDMLAYSAATVIDELYLAINHCLLATGRPEEIREIYSHPQALSQCRRYLTEHFPNADLISTASTTRAAELAVESPERAALAGRAAAGLYNLPLLAENVEDVPGNTTRFLILGTKPARPTGNDKTSICFGLADRPGALYRALRPFEERCITLSMIESRPSKANAFEYFFFIDMAGHIDDAPVAEACREVEAQSVFMKILGSYPCARQ